MVKSCVLATLFVACCMGSPALAARSSDSSPPRPCKELCKELGPTESECSFQVGDDTKVFSCMGLTACGTPAHKEDMYKIECNEEFARGQGFVHCDSVCGTG